MIALLVIFVIDPAIWALCWKLQPAGYGEFDRNMRIIRSNLVVIGLNLVVIVGMRLVA